MGCHASRKYRVFYCWLLSIGLFCVSLWPVASVQAASIQLSGAEVATGLFQISPDSQQVVYLAKATPGDHFDTLYRVSLLGDNPIALHATPVEPIPAYVISPDSSQVIYQYGADLYRVPIAGPASTRVKLNLAALTVASQPQFALSPDGQTIVYRTPDALYAVPLTGAADQSIQLNRADLLPAEFGRFGNTTTDFVITPDSQRVLYGAREGDTGASLYSVPLTGPASASLLLNTPTPGADLLWITVSPDSQYVLYLSDQATDMTFELYRTPLAGPADQLVKLNVALAAGESVYQYATSADAAWVVYGKGGELYSVPLAGSVADSIHLNQGWSAGRLDAFALSADSQFVVLQGGDLYRVPIAGPARELVQLTDTVAGGRGVSEFQISPDSAYVLYTAYATTTSALELYSMPLLGTPDTSVKLNRPLATVEQPLSFTITPDSQRVVYEAYQDAADTNELYSVPIAGPASLGLKLNAPVMNGGIWPLHWQVSPDSSRVVYLAGGKLYVADSGERTLYFDLSPLAVNEATTTAALPFTLDQASILTVTVAYSVTIERSPDNAGEPSLTAGVLAFAPGEITQTLPILLDPRARKPDAETIRLDLRDPHNAHLATDGLTWMLVDNRVLIPDLQYNYLPVMQLQP